MREGYNKAEKHLKDYLTGKLRTDIDMRKLIIKTEHNGLDYSDDKTYNVLQTRLKAIDSYLQYLKDTERRTHRIIMLFDYHKLPWANVANAIHLSESACQRRRKKAIKELAKWL